MDGIPPRLNYAEMHKEIDNQSSIEQVRKIAFKLLIENKLQAHKYSKKDAALKQIHLLMHKQYMALQYKVSEVRLLEKCLAISQNSRDSFLKNFVKFLEKSCDGGFQKIFSSLSFEPSIKFLTHTINSASCNLMMARLMVMHYLENYKEYDSELSGESNVALCLGFIDEAIKLVMQMMKSFKGNQDNRKRKNAMGTSMENNRTKRRKIQEGNEDYGFNKLKSRQSKKVILNGSIVNDTISRSGNQLANPIPLRKKYEKVKCLHTRWLVVRLVDVLNDPTAECDPVVVLYKQTNLFKDIEDCEFKVVDDVGASSDEEDIVSNDNKSDLLNNETSVEHKSYNSSSEQNIEEASISGSDVGSQDGENAEQESASVKSYDDDVDDDDDDDDDDDNEVNTPGSSGCISPPFVRGPRTPPTSPPSSPFRSSEYPKEKSPGNSKSNYPVYHIRGPRTPSLPPPSPPGSPTELYTENSDRGGPHSPGDEGKAPGNSKSNYPVFHRKGPQTPSPPELPELNAEIFPRRRGPRTPPLPFPEVSRDACQSEDDSSKSGSFVSASSDLEEDDSS